MTYTAFLGERLLARGDMKTIARAAREATAEALVVLEDASGRVLDVDVRQVSDAPPAREVETAAEPLQRRGRPKLGVVAREVTLLPRHWDWLSTQPGGASAALRRLVDQARKDNADLDVRRQRQETTYRAATALAGDRPRYEDAMRALFAGDLLEFERLIGAWPADIAAYLRELTSGS